MAAPANGYIPNAGLVGEANRGTNIVFVYTACNRRRIPVDVKIPNPAVLIIVGIARDDDLPAQVLLQPFVQLLVCHLAPPHLGTHLGGARKTTSALVARICANPS